MAISKVTSGGIADGTLSVEDIKDDAVTAAKLANSINTDIATGVTGNTTANAALPKAGGAMTGAITTNSTFDGVDIATRDGVLTSTTATAAAALPKAGGTMTGTTAHGDGVASTFGDSADLTISHSGGSTYLTNTTGSLILRTDSLRVLNTANSEQILHGDADGAVSAYHNNVKKLETTAAGVTAINIQSASNKFTNSNIACATTSTENGTGFCGVSYGSSTAANYGWTAGVERGTNGTASEFVFTAHNASASGTERMRITADGRGLSQFTAKAWVSFNGSGTVAIKDSHNIASITDHGVGEYTASFTNNLANANYATVGMASNWETTNEDSYMSVHGYEGGQAVGSQRVRTIRMRFDAGTVYKDPKTVNLVMFGD